MSAADGGGVDLYYAFPGHTMDVLAKAEHLRKRSDVLSKAAAAISEPSLSELGKVYASFAGCMELLARQLSFKAGDPVRLTKAPKCDGGWKNSAHFLIAGAVGTIKAVEIDYLMRDWAVYVEFDDESHICSFAYDGHAIGDVIPTEPGQRHVYGFKPSSVELLTTATAPAQGEP